MNGSVNRNGKAEAMGDLVQVSLSDKAVRLLEMADAFPVLQPERERLGKALEMLYSQEWQSVVVRLSGDDLAKLGRGREIIDQDCGDLELILRVSELVGEMYGFDQVDVPQIAVAFAVTSQAATAVDTVAESFGLGQLDDSGEIFSKYRQVDSSAGLKSALSPLQELDIRLRGMASFLQSFSPWANMVVRLGAAAFISWLAIRSGHFQFLFIGVAAVLSSSNPRGDWLPGDRVAGYRPSWGELRKPWPWLGLVAMAAMLMGSPNVAWIVVLEYVVVEGLRTLCHRQWAKGLVLINDSILPLARNAMLSISLPDRIIASRKFSCMAFELLGLFIAFRLSVIATPVLFFVYVFAVRGNWKLLVVSVLAAGVLIHVAWWALVLFAVFGLIAYWILRSRERIGVPATPVVFDWEWFTRPSSLIYALHARALLRRGLPSAAARVMERPGKRSSSAELLLRSWAHLQANEPGKAKRLLLASGRSETPFGGLIGCMIACELGETDDPGYSKLEIRSWTGSPRLRWWVAVASAKWLMVEALPELRPAVTAQLLSLAMSRTDVVRSSISMRLAAESCLRWSPANAAIFATVTALIVDNTLGMDQYDNEFEPIGPTRVLFEERFRSFGVVTEAVGLMAEEETIQWNGESLGLQLAQVLMALGQPVEAARVINRFADRNENHVLYRGRALGARLEAISVLNSMRHRIEDPTDRKLWWRELGSAFEAAMRQASNGKDWRTLAELIESARLQLDTTDPATVAEVPPYVTVRGRAALAETNWFETSSTPPAYALEDGAAWVGGLGTYWWSSWTAGPLLYWVLVPPTGDVEGGVIDLEATGITAALSDLAAFVPGIRPEEDEFDYELRMLDSPLVSGPFEAERKFALRLSALIPPSLRGLLVKAKRPVRLALAPDRSLAAVPWASIAIPEGGGDHRMVEKASVLLAPPLSLLVAMSRRPAPLGALPIALTVANPGGDLPFAENLNALLSDTTADNPPAGAWTVKALSDRLKGLDYGSTAVFVCHTDRRDNTPGGMGLLLSPLLNSSDSHEPTAKELVTAADLMQENAAFPMPSQVVLLACDSANLGETDAGEWLVLGPAMLMAGAQRTVVTSFPVIDLNAMDAELLEQISTPHASLESGLQTLQRSALQRWKSGDASAAPAHWAGHSLLGGFTRHPVELMPVPTTLLKVDTGLIGLLDGAAERARSRDRHEVAWWDIAMSLVLYGHMEDMRWVRDKLGFLVGSTDAAITWLRTRNAVKGREPLGELSSGVTDLLVMARSLALRARHPVVSVEHLLAAVLQSNGIQGLIIRALYGLDARNPEVIKFLLSSETEPGYRHTNLPKTEHLSGNAIESAYETLSAALPERDEKSWYYHGTRSL